MTLSGSLQQLPPSTGAECTPNDVITDLLSARISASLRHRQIPYIDLQRCTGFFIIMCDSSGHFFSISLLGICKIWNSGRSKGGGETRELL
jgi:hypothetical protein